MIQADCLHSLANVANQFVDLATHVPERAKGLFKVTCEPLPTPCDAVVQRVRRKGKTAPTNELGIETRQFMQKSKVLSPASLTRAPLAFPLSTNFSEASKSFVKASKSYIWNTTISACPHTSLCAVSEAARCVQIGRVCSHTSEAVSAKLEFFGSSVDTDGRLVKFAKRFRAKVAKELFGYWPKYA